MRQIEPLINGNFYHIYNRGINSCDVFTENSNYEYFLDLYDKYISPIADTFAWVLMKNHFHFLVRIKGEEDVQTLSAVPNTLSGVSNPERVKFPVPSHHFSHLFNAYAQAFNKRNGRTGSLFEHPFKRKSIEDMEHFKSMIVYIHNNPVHHGFTQQAMDYPWSSYLTCISVKPTRLQRDAVVGWFDSTADFRTAHDNQGDIIDLENWLGI